MRQSFLTCPPDVLAIAPGTDQGVVQPHVAVHSAPDGAAVLRADLHRLLGVRNAQAMNVGALAQVRGQLWLVPMRLGDAIHFGTVEEAVGLAGHQRPLGIGCLQEQPVILQEFEEVLQ